MTTKEWIELWLSRIPNNLEIRPIDKNGNVIIQERLFSRDVNTILNCIHHNQRYNLFFGVCGRDSYLEGTKDVINTAECIWADIDFKDLPDGKVEADGIIATFDLQPTILVESGGGYHLYWFLDKPTTDMERIERILKGLVPRLKSDTKVAQIASVLRPIGTLNYKYDPPKEVLLSYYKPENEYTLDDFKEWELPEVEKEVDLGDDKDARFNLKRYLKQYKVQIVKVKPFESSTLYCLKNCLFEEEHTVNEGAANEAAIGQQESGKLFYQCFHNSCKDKKWEDAKKKISGLDDLSSFVLRDLRPLIENYVVSLTGETSIGSLLSWFDIKTFTERQEALSILKDMAKKNDIIWIGHKHGVFRRVDKNPNVMDIDAPQKDDIGVSLPLGLHTLVVLYPRNVILVAGEKDSGKTAFALNTAWLNRNHMDVTYFNSEMGTTELQSRIRNFPKDKFDRKEWKKIKFIEKASRFEDFIDPNGLNIIDFLEIGAEAFTVTEDIKRVFDKLDKGLLLIVMQKRSYKEYAVGGEGTLEKARLAINLEHRDKTNVCKITVAKNWTTLIHSPRGCECLYKIWNGGEMKTDSEWHRPEEIDTKAKKPKGY